MADKRVVYGANCVWWDTIDKVAAKESGLPCCPHCGSVLMEVPTLESWWNNVDEHEKKGNPGYRDMMEWMRGRCFRTMADAKTAYETRMAKTCEMIVGWKVDEHGDPGEETYCTREATHDHEGVLCCDVCAEALRKEDLPVEPLDDR